MADITNVKLGPCTVTFKGVDLGHTIGGVEVTYEPEYKDIKVDKFAAAAEKVLIGEKMMAKVPLGEFTMANLDVAIPDGVKTAGKITIGANKGKRASSNAGLLVLHPIVNASNDRSEDIGIYKAVVADVVVIGLKPDEEKILEVTFHGIVDEGRSDGNLLGVIGDSTG